MTLALSRETGSSPSSRIADAEVPTIAPAALRLLATGIEDVAIVDVRDNPEYVVGHISVAVELPIGEIETRADALLPRRGATIVVVDDDGGALAFEAARRLLAHGYSDVRVLDGGLARWTKDGNILITGEFSLSKALGEFVERQYHTPKITAEELKVKIDTGQAPVIIDTRPLEEFNKISIPGGVAAPGAELLYRIFDKVPSPETPVFINCAGRTRAIIGAQALRNIGFPNPIYSLENGTSAWLLRGFEPARGAVEALPPPSADAVAKAGKAAATLDARFAIKLLDRDKFAAFRVERDRKTLYVFDVRTAEEYASGHLSDALHAPGGQLVQNTDRFVGIRQARIVLVDGTDLVRARITASWLFQAGFDDVYVYAAGPTELAETGAPLARILGSDISASSITAPELKARVDREDAAVLDIQPPPPYWLDRTYIPGSFVARRRTLGDTIGRVPGSGAIVLTSADGTLARLAAAEAAHATPRPVLALAGGTRAWVEAGYESRTGLDQPAIDQRDALKPLPTLEQRRVHLDAYVRWGDHITDELAKDGLVRFRKPLSR